MIDAISVGILKEMAGSRIILEALIQSALDLGVIVITFIPNIFNFIEILLKKGILVLIGLANMFDICSAYITL